MTSPVWLVTKAIDMVMTPKMKVIKVNQILGPNFLHRMFAGLGLG